MPSRVRITAPRRQRAAERLDASALVKAQADAVITYLGESIRNGYVAATGEARPRKPDGKPVGFATGELANGLRATKLLKNRRRATITIEAPHDPGRRIFVATNPDFITLDGIVDEVRREAVDNYLAETLA